MNRLELAQEINDKIKLIGKSQLIQGHRVMAQVIHSKGVIFSVWVDGSMDGCSIYFYADMSRVYPSGDYTGGIDEAKAALKEFLEGDV